MSDLDLEVTFREVREFVLRLLVLGVRSLKRWPVWIAAAVAAAPAAWFAPRLLPPVFESQTVLMYRETLQADSLLGPQPNRESWAQMSRRFIDTVLSCSSLEGVVKELGLYPDIVRDDGMVAACEEVRRNTTIEAPHSSNAVVVGFRGHEPEKVRAVAARLADLLKKQPGRAAAARAEATREFLEEEARLLKQDLEDKERALAAFLAVNPEFALDELVSRGARVGVMTRAAERDAAGTSRSARLAALARQAQRLMRRLEAGPAAVVETRTGDMVRVDPSLLAAERAVAEAASRLGKLRAEFTDLHPDVVHAREQLLDARADLAKTRAGTARFSKPASAAAPVINEGEKDREIEARLREVNAAMQAERNASARRDSSQRTVEPVVAMEIRWVSLSREVDHARERYESVEQRLFQASTVAKMESSGGQGELLTMDSAYLPSRPMARGPRRTRVLAVAACLMLGAALAFLLTLLDDRVYGVYEVRSLKLGRIVHSVPRCRTAEEEALVHV